MNFKTPVKARIFIGFFSYSLVSFLVAFACFFLFRKIDTLEKTEFVVHQLYANTLNALIAGKDFLYFDSSHERFYRTGESDMIAEQEAHFKTVNDLTQNLIRLEKHSDLDLSLHLVSIDSMIKDYQASFKLYTQRVSERGVKGYGMIGDMRDYVHQLSEAQELDAVQLLTIRRHEKDYLLWGDVDDIAQFRNTAQEIKLTIERINRNTPDRLRKNLWLLDNYSQMFEKVVLIDEEIGYKRLSGLSQHLRQLSMNLESEVAILSKNASDRKTGLSNQVQTTVLALITISMILLIILTVAFKYVFAPEVSKLTTQMHP